MPTRKLVKWNILLRKFDIVYMTQKPIKGQALADHLAKNPVDKDYDPLTTAANFKGVGIGEVLITESGQHYLASAKIIFRCTNNMAEYEACIVEIRMAVDMNIKVLLVIGDSDLLIHQVQGEWSTKNVKIYPYLHCVKELCKKLTKIEFKHVPRIHNEFADALTILISMIQHPDKNYIYPIKEEIRYQHAYYFHVDEKPDGKPWYHDIKRFLETREYPESATNS
ncbi:uncharacterized protein LOC142163911 [Nicotiana tabacum]|uniref:Uncharacterized protein LOC142163911 n=1 Tax=Nicotiana tabacum TaxID=4097 RepID=A0AC58RWR8_TOBAC